MMRSLACAALCASLFIANAPAAASEPSQDPISAAPQMGAVAQRHFDDAVAFYKAGNYDAAKVEFSAAYDLSHLPDLLHNLSLVAEQQGRYREAITLEERCLAEKGSSATLPEQDEARGRVTRLRERMAGGPQKEPAQSVTPAVASVVSPVPNARDPRRTPWPAVALVGVGSGLLLAGIGCGAGALATQARVNGGGPFFADEYDGLANRGRALEKSAISLSVVGGVLVASGAGWLIGHRARTKTR